MKSVIVSLVTLLTLAIIQGGLANVEYSNYWVVRLRPGAVADDVADIHGLKNLGEVLPGRRNLFEFMSETGDIHGLEDHPSVISATRQEYYENEAKGFYVLSEPHQLRQRRNVPDFNDPMWPQSWHLHPNYTSVGMNILGAWKQGYKGKGVTVVHLDDGLDYWHPDLWNAYDASVSYDFQDDDNLPFPHDNQTHGTAMAGIVAARANNTVCSVGIAHEATIGMRREALTRSIKTYGSKQARIIAYKMDQVDIYVFGYGPRDRGNGVQAPSDLVVEAIENGVQRGRDGKGIIFVYPSGNGGLYKDSCALDWGANLIQLMSINSVGEYGTVPRYAENCTAVIASAFSSGKYPERYMVTTAPGGKCIDNFTGTSSSTAVAAGVMALVLESNPSLTWRDVQHLVVRHSSRAELNPNADWQQNGAGHVYSRSFGFGLLNADQLVRAAQTWKPVSRQYLCSITSSETQVIDPEQEHTFKMQVRNCQGIKSLEHVVVQFTATALKRGDVELVLKSPASKNKSQLLSPRPFDFGTGGFFDWQILSMEQWDENPNGIWELTARNAGPVHKSTSRPITFSSWTLKLYGTRNDNRNSG